jgi:hypothetical protein
VRKEELEEADKILGMLFTHAASDVAQLIDVAHNLNDDAIDVRLVLRTLCENAGHHKTEAIYEAIKNNETGN